MIVKQTNNIGEIKAVLCHPDICDKISNKGDSLEPPITKDYKYIGGYVNSKIVGVMIYHKYLDGNECHVQVLPEYRKEYALNFGEQSLEFRGTRPLYAEIPDLYKNVLDFALINNFKVIEVRKNDFIKDGKTYNVNVLRYDEWASLES